MSKSITELREQLQKTMGEAQEILAKSEKENRQLSDDEKTQVKAIIEKAKPIEKEILSAKGQEDIRRQVSDLVNINTGEKSTGPKAKGSLGEQFVNSSQYKDLTQRGLKGSSWSTGPVELEVGRKALLTEDAASGGDLIQPQVTGAGPVPLLFRRLTVADLIPSGNTTSNTVRYLKETTATNAAAAVAEGATKPESTLIFDAVDDPVKKIATLLPVTDEMLEDYAQIQSYIDGRLRLFVQLTEEDQLLNGSGAGANITGILNRTGIQTQAVGADTVVDAIYKAVTKVRSTGFLEPDGLVIHPNDWQAVRLAKDSNGQYFGGGPFTGAYGVGGIPGDMLWGLRAVVTPAIAENTALVGAFAQSAQVFRKGGITVEASNSHSTFFAENKTAIRAEERLALAVYRALGFCTVTGV